MARDDGRLDMLLRIMHASEGGHDYETTLLNVIRAISREMDAAVKAPPSHGHLSIDQVMVGLKNLGHGECGNCAALFFTGYGGYEHDAECPVVAQAELVATLARLLKEREWTTYESDPSTPMGDVVCNSCDVQGNKYDKPPPKHKPGCQIAKALKDAGVAVQIEEAKGG